MTRVLIPALFTLLFAASSLVAQPPALTTRDVATGLDTPWEILWGPDDWLWITERFGRVSRIDPETGAQDVLLVLPDVHEQSESGLLGMALHPGFADTPHVFLVYNFLTPAGIRERLVRYTYDGDTLTGRTILLDSLLGNGNHNGSRLLITPDRKILMTTGDVQDVSTAQDLSSLSGKILRLNLDGSAPEDNPWSGVAGVAGEIWTLGHRNPQGLAFGPNGILYESEHGPNDNDEVNIMYAGRNYGWPNVRGYCDQPAETTFCADSNVVEPITAWTPTLAVAGIAWYGSPAITAWTNSLLVTTLKESDLRILHLSEDGMSVTSVETVYDNRWGRLRDIAVAPDGRIFIATSNKDGRGTVRQGDDRIIEISADAPGIINVMAPASFRGGDTIEISFETTEPFNPGNVFTASLSDVGGGFNAPTPLGFITSTTGGTIIGVVPCGTLGGKAYRIRVAATNPVSFSQTTPPLQINPGPTLLVTPSGNVDACEGDSVRLTASEGFASYEWSNGDTNRVLVVPAAGGFFVTVRDSNGCRSTSSSVVVRFAPRPEPTIERRGDTLLAPAGFQAYRWYLEGELLNEMSRQLVTTQSGNYRVEVRSFQGCEGSSATLFVGPSGVDRERPVVGELAIRPKPVRDHVALEVDLGNEASSLVVEVIDVAGARLMRLEEDRVSGLWRRSVDLSLVPAGAYVVTVTAGERQWSGRMVVER